MTSLARCVVDERRNGGDLDPSPRHAAKGGIADDFDCECNALLEYGAALNVAGDRTVNAVGRLRKARTEDERERIRDELRRFLRTTVAAATIAFAALGGDINVKGEAP